MIEGPEPVETRLRLGSRLSDIAYVHAWVERVASANGISPDLKFAMELCLEEAISNVIRHGYGPDANGTVTVQFAMPHKGSFVFEVEDHARPFNPLGAPEIPALSLGREMRVGGEGLRLLRSFANMIEYVPMPGGNRLRIGFQATPGSSEDAASF
jgi:anti-sigma regulatory factor (Ser/Thr protein kinase)